MPFPFFKKKLKEEKKEEFELDLEPSLRDLISPSAILLTPHYLKIDEKYFRGYFVYTYPRYLHPAWLAQMIFLPTNFDISIHIHPVSTALYLKKLLRKLTEVQAEILERQEKLKVRDPELETAQRDIEKLRDKLTIGQEKIFHVGIYLGLYASLEEELKNLENIVRSIFETKLIYLKKATFQQKEVFLSCLPVGLDKIYINEPLNTEALTTTFPFVSLDITSNEGILYGINSQNNSLILFDRFSLENANMVIFGTSGSGKSYFAKMEILRNLMLGVDFLIIDPENEYQRLAQSIDGSFLDISLSSPHHLNPFDLPLPKEDEKPEEVLRANIVNLVGLLRIMLGGLTSEEDALCDRALKETYAIKDITPESDPKTWPQKVPLMEDFVSVLESMEGAESLARKLKKFTEGSFANFFNNYTNVSLDNRLVVFGIRNMEENLRPIAIYIIMRYIWAKIREELKKRILVIDEAWWLMKNEDSASFLFGLVKRARKYWLGVTTITQDVEDFLKSDYGRPILTNSALACLFKQRPATIDILQKTFALTEAEKNLLLETVVGEGLFFAGDNHTTISVVASYLEDQIITSSPAEIAKLKKKKYE